MNNMKEKLKKHGLAFIVGVGVGGGGVAAIPEDPPPKPNYSVWDDAGTFGKPADTDK